jgi:hypothetical protein
VNQACNKLFQLQNIASVDNDSVIAITESWLNNSVNDNEILNSNYVIYRRDRQTNCRGGGIVLAVKHTLVSTLVHSDSENEIIAVSVSMSQNRSVLFILCYRPPSSDLNNFVNSLNTVLSTLSGKHSRVCLLGDFNVPGVNWGDNFYSSNCPSEASFVELLDDFGLKQLNKHPSTVNGNILDLVLVNFDPVSEVHVKNCEFSSDHKVLDFVINLNTNRIRTKRQWVYNYKAMDIDTVRNKLNNADLCSIVNNSANINEIWDSWLETVTSIINECVPKVKLNNTHEVAWFDQEVRHMRNKKNTAWRRAKRLNKPKDWKKFRKLRNSLINMLKTKYRKFINELGLSLKENPKQFWSYIKSKTGTGSVPTVVNWESKVADDPDSQASLFNEYFYSVFTQEDIDPEVENCLPLKAQKIKFLISRYRKKRFLKFFLI